MKLLLSLLAVFALTEAFVPVAPIPTNRRIQEDDRVLGGTTANINEFPHMVAVISSASDNITTFCGGSLISTRHIITAAHCVPDNTVTHAVLGTLQAMNEQSQGYVKILISNKVKHQYYNPAAQDYDIALLTLSSEVTETENIRHIDLPRANTNNDLNGRTATLTGWGKVNDDENGYLNTYLLKANVPVVDLQVCIDSYGTGYVNDRKVCVSTNSGTVGACYGDSGSPLILNDPNNGELIQVGVMSFGASVGCTAGFPTVYTRLTSYTQWIQDNGGPSVRP